MIIYKAINKINSMSYIGQTIESLNSRISKHIYDAQNKKNNMYFHKAIRKHGIENFDWNIIDECDGIEELNKLEAYYIGFYNTYNNGYNLTLGGEGSVGYKHTEEIKQKMRKPKSKEARRNMSEARKGKFTGENSPNYGKHPTEETRQKLSESHKGHIVLEETRRKLSEIGKNRIVTIETRRKLSKSKSGNNNPKAKSILLIHPNDVEERFDCMADASRKYKLNNLSRVAQGKQKQTKGFRCKYC